MAILVLPAAAKEIPAQLPDPDGKAPETTKPVKVYILAGQSNMVGMGNISGARCRYTGIYLTADPAAPKGPKYIYPVGNYKISPHGVYVSADPKADKGATVSIYKGAYNPATDYDKAKPSKQQLASADTESQFPDMPPYQFPPQEVNNILKKYTGAESAEEFAKVYDVNKYKELEKEINLRYGPQNGCGEKCRI
jgi:hypothetical protein